MQPLLTVLVTWLSVNFSLPATYEHPTIELVSPAAMGEIRLSRALPVEPGSIGEAPVHPAVAKFHAVYDDASRTIYLTKGWTGATPAEVSVLVHELVHHLQNAAGSKYTCAAEREKLAYRAQARWLELFGTNLAAEFGIDAMTILVRTNCMH